MDTPIVILNYKTYLESSGIKALELAHDLESAANESGITMVAAPGVPGGAIMAALGLLASMLGFNEDLQGLMIALYIAMDTFGTACNVTGDGAIALVMNKIYKK